MFFRYPWRNNTEDQPMDQEEDNANDRHQDPQGCVQRHQGEQLREQKDQCKALEDQSYDHTRFPPIDLS